MKAPISLCMIVKNEPFLEKCLLSIRDFVSEIVIVDTGSTDDTPLIAKKYADIFEVYTECNNPETGLIEDFSQARSRSFELATQPWVMWCDGDDLIEGGENLSTLIKEYENSSIKNKTDAVAFLFPYEYAYNEQGQCILRHYRERLLSNKNSFAWTNPVHEVIVPKGNDSVNMFPEDRIVFKHQRQFTPKTIEPNRNLRILKKYYEKVGDSDPRQLYYLGLEYSNSGMIDEAIAHLIKYTQISGWEDEIVMACLKLIDIYCNLGEHEKALPWAFKAIEIKENWCEGYLSLAKLFYFIALKGGPNEIRNWQRCVHFSKEGLRLPPTKTLLFVNPLDRDYFSHVYLNFALNKIGDVSGALESAHAGLKSKPDDQMLLGNKTLYENFLSRQKIMESIGTLKNNGVIDQVASERVNAIINNLADVAISAPTIETTFTINKEVKSLLKRTHDKPLDIVFFLGDGVEIWTPETVRKTGIGGSELMALSMSQRLATLGHKVRVYNSCGNDEGIYDGVEYYQSSKYKDIECDVLIVSRNASALGNPSVKAKLKLLWVHDIFAINATNELLLKADRILALSNWHKEFLVKHHNIHPKHIIVTRNGIDLSRFQKYVPRNRFKCVNSSSPDRSWPVLLEMWPKIKERVPEAELHLYYGFKNWDHGAQFDPKQKDLIVFLKNKIAIMSRLGVVYHDRVDQQTLANELLSSGVWTFPTWFTETSCITAMEMQAAGVRMVTSNLAALKETAGSRATLLDGEWTSPEYQEKFINAVVEKLTNTDDSDRLMLQQYAKDNFDLDSLAQQWDDMFYSLFQELKTNPLVPYFPTKKYLTEKSYEDHIVNNLVDSKNLVKLNIGAGPNIFPYDGWINYDRCQFSEYFGQLHAVAAELMKAPLEQCSPNTQSWTLSMTAHQEKIINYLVGGGSIEYRLKDVNYPFNQHPDDSVDIIYLGQMIEHLNPIYTVPNLLKDCHRMLKPGGILRITTPDLDLLIDAYQNNTLDKFASEQPQFYKTADPSSQLSYIMFGACGPYCTWDNYEGHMFLFTKLSMRHALRQAGFENIAFFSASHLTNNDVIRQEVTDEGLSHSLLVEATK